MKNKNLLLALLIAIFAILSSAPSAMAEHSEDSPMVRLLTSKNKSKILKDAKLKLARPFIKLTPMGILIDDINELIIYSLDMEEENDTSLLSEAKTVFKKYDLVKTIDDEKSNLHIYIDTPQNDQFSEIILYRTRPDPTIMVFIGDFTLESLKKVGEASENERKHLKKNN